MKKQAFVVRFAGEGGQGVVTSAEGLAQAMAQSGYNVQTFSTFPSQIEHMKTTEIGFVLLIFVFVMFFLEQTLDNMRLVL